MVQIMDEFLFGDVLFRWEGGGYELANGRYAQHFRSADADVIEKIVFHGSFESLERYTRYPRIAENQVYDTYQIDGEKLLIYHWGKLRSGFGIWPERIESGREDVCTFDLKMRDQVPMNEDWFFGVSGLHSALLKMDAPILHASYVDYRGQGILFTAPSQTGKTTQAQLWHDVTGAEIINGDRVLLRKRGDIWYSFGYPCCGSSNICINRAVPLAAIAVVEQSRENHIEEVSAAKKIKAIVTATEMYPQNHIELERALNLAEDLALRVPIVRLCCRPDEGAVNVLKDYLEENGHAKRI